MTHSLAPLVNKVKEAHVEIIVDTLCTNMTSSSEHLRDISSIALKTVISELPQSSGILVTTISKKITSRLTDSVSQVSSLLTHLRRHDSYLLISKQKGDQTVQLEALDILSDLLNRFGSLLTPYHGSIQEALMPQLLSARLAVRKRSITALSYLLVSCNQNLFNLTIEKLVNQLVAQKSNVGTVRTYIQCIAAISRQAGHRFGDHLQGVVPLVTSFTSVDDDELKEYCLQALESFVRKSPKEMNPFIPNIIKICLEYLQYDPNYNYDDVEDEEDMEMDNGDDDGADSGGSFTDDDDVSWKVRRASAKCLEAVIATRPDMTTQFYRTIAPQLIARFRGVFDVL